jgi:hypothetical protein
VTAWKTISGYSTHKKRKAAVPSGGLLLEDGRENGGLTDKSVLPIRAWIK